MNILWTLFVCLFGFFFPAGGKGDVVDDVQKIFDDYAGEGAFESLPTIITALKDKEVAMAMEMEPTDDELGDLASACQKLWTLDYNR